MSTEALGELAFHGMVFHIYRSDFDNGRFGFMAETAWDDGDRVLLDHWNLSALYKELEKLVPLMTKARLITNHA